MNEIEQLLRKLIDHGMLFPEEEKLVDDALLNIEIRLTPKTRFLEFFDEYNNVRKTKYQPSIESRRLYYESEVIFTNHERIQAYCNALTDPWIIEKSFPVTPQWILKRENLEKYLHYAAPNTKGSNGQPAKNIERVSVV